MDMSPFEGEAAVMAIEYVYKYEPDLQKRSPPFRKAAFTELLELEERAALLQLLKGCPLPDDVSAECVANGRFRAENGIILQTLNPELAPVWFGYDLKMEQGFARSLGPDAKHKVEAWFYTGLLLAHDLLNSRSRSRFN